MDAFRVLLYLCVPSMCLPVACVKHSRPFPVGDSPLLSSDCWDGHTSHLLGELFVGKWMGLGMA